MTDYAAIVIGGGHAGVEAALALARLGHTTLLVTQNPDAIGRMSCNPAIGGLGKGNLVRELDALGGEMGLLIDGSMIQFRMLNSSRGAAVQAPRAQADKSLYSSLARRSLESQKGLSILMDTVVDLIGSSDGRKVEGVVTERGRRLGARAVVLTTGTFMEGRVFIGSWSASSGRLGEAAAVGLGGALRGRGFPVGRLKTGTPARIKARSVDFTALSRDNGDAHRRPFSFVSA
ncbi:MAG: FAD-dependent oxidoreductase, partial [Spirochaetota bacterium]